MLRTGFSDIKGVLQLFIRNPNAVFFSFRQFHLCPVVRYSSESPNPKEETDLTELDVDEEKELEIEQKRNKNRLPDRVYKIGVLKETPRPEMKYDFKKSRLKAHYGKYGESSGLNPGILWPTREELQDKIEYEKMFYRSLEENLEKIRTEKAERLRAMREYEETVDQNMSKHDQWLKQYYDNIEKKKAMAEEAKLRREQLIEEISEFLGYDVDPSDPRFKEAVEKKEKEKKKARREKKQEESYNKLLQKLTEVSEDKEEDDDDEPNK